jgi:hypothetical protein
MFSHKTPRGKSTVDSNPLETLFSSSSADELEALREVETPHLTEQPLNQPLADSKVVGPKQPVEYHPTETIRYSHWEFNEDGTGQHWSMKRPATMAEAETKRAERKGQRGPVARLFNWLRGTP